MHNPHTCKDLRNGPSSADLLRTRGDNVIYFLFGRWLWWRFYARIRFTQGPLSSQTTQCRALYQCVCVSVAWEYKSQQCACTNKSNMYYLTYQLKLSFHITSLHLMDAVCTYYTPVYVHIVLYAPVKKMLEHFCFLVAVCMYAGICSSSALTPPTDLLTNHCSFSIFNCCTETMSGFPLLLEFL